MKIGSVDFHEREVTFTIFAMKRRVAVLAAVAMFTLAPAAVSALGLVPIIPQGSDCNDAGGCQSICDITTVAQNVLDDGIYVAIFLSAILFAWAGWQLVISGENPTMRTHAKHIFMYVTGGLVLIISAWIIVSVIMGVLTNSSTWNALCASGTASTATTVQTVAP